VSSNLIFIYDGECPFCNQFAELLELKSGIPEISIMDGRANLPEIKALFEKGFDLDQGAILLRGNEVLHGSRAINWICSQIDDPSDPLLKLLSVTFSSNKRTDFIFPFLLIARRTLLSLRGVHHKLVI